MQHIRCRIGNFPLNYHHHCKMVEAASPDSGKVSLNFITHTSMNDILLQVKIKYKIYFLSIFTSFIFLVKVYFPYLNIPTVTRSLLKYSAMFISIQFVVPSSTVSLTNIIMNIFYDCNFHRYLCERPPHFSRCRPVTVTVRKIAPILASHLIHLC